MSPSSTLPSYSRDSTSSSSSTSFSSNSKDVISLIPSHQALSPPLSHALAQKGLLENLDFSKDSVRIYAYSQGGVVIHPGLPRGENGEDEGEGGLRGFFQVVSSTRRVVKRIRIRFNALQSISFPQDRGNKEEDEVFAKEVSFGADSDDDGFVLMKGVSTFEFALSIPSDISPRQWSPQSSITHYITGTVVGSAKGFFGKDLEARQTVWVMAAPEASSHAETFSFDAHENNFTKELGPVSLDVSSSRLIVGGAIVVKIHLPSPPSNLRIYAIRSHIEETAAFTSSRFSTKTAVVKIPKAKVFDAGAQGKFFDGKAGVLDSVTPIFDAVKRGEWEFERFARVPGHFDCRPTTHPSTNASVRNSHSLVVEVYFTLAEPNDPSSLKVMIASVFRRDVTVGSCGCLIERLSLSDYTVDTKEFKPTSTITDGCWPCKCKETEGEVRREEKEIVASRRSRAESRGSADESELGEELSRKAGELS